MTEIVLQYGAVCRKCTSRIPAGTTAQYFPQAGRQQRFEHMDGECQWSAMPPSRGHVRLNPSSAEERAADRILIAGRQRTHQQNRALRNPTHPTG